MRQEKQFLLDEIQENIENSEAFVLASYGALLANQANDFRRKLREAGANLKVVRKRVFLKAAQSAGIEDIDPATLEGSVAIVFATGDTVNATKAVCNFAEESADIVKVLGGHFDGQVLNASQVDALSKLPGRDEMRAQLLGLFEAPLSQTLATMEALLCSVPYALENKANAEGGEGN